MAKVEFKLNDTLLRRQRGERDPRDPPPSSTRIEAGGVVAVEPPAAKPAESLPEPAHRPPQPWRGESPQASRRPLSVQTSVLMPAPLWDQLARLASESGGLATPNRVLIDVLDARGPRDLEQAAENLDRFLSLPSEQSGVGDPWEERNVRLPIELRKHLDELRRRLTAAGVSQATRAHLIAATILLHGPSTGEEARALMAELRTQAFRRAVASEAV
jgi:hypothetical protein